MPANLESSPAFATWLAQRIGADSVSVDSTSTPSGGFSAETIIATVTSRRENRYDPETYVLRLETPDPAVYPQQSSEELAEIKIQYRVMDAVRRHSSVPVAPLIGFEPDETVIGTPFFAMGCVDGDVPRESPPYPTEGFFRTSSPVERRSMITSGIETLADIHRIDWRTAGLSWLEHDGVAPGTPTQLERWSQFATAELRGRSHPLLEDAFVWLGRSLPADSDIVLCWGDPRPGNIIYADAVPACVTDFEAACIASPMMDLAWWLMFDRTMHELGATDETASRRLDGDPDRDEQRKHYFEVSGRPAEDTGAHEVFAAVRYAVIVTRVMNRLEARGQLPPDSTIWRDNPASTCLEILLDEMRS
ncbi:COG3173 Predicted aminoglycoside phosphotransferase [Acidimicrobiia bacterium]